MTWITAQAPFRMPNGLTLNEQINFCVEIINRYRKESPYLRMKSTKLEEQNEKLKREVEFWKEQYRKEKQEKEYFKKEIEKLTKANKRYQIALFDHGNFKHKELTNKKAKGGQRGHKDTNRENKLNFEGYEQYPRKRIYTFSCNHCGSKVKRAKAFKQKVLLDIIIKPEIVKCVLESERQWCITCQKEITARSEESLPFTEYGLNTFMMIIVLRFKGHLSLSSISSVLSIGFGLVLSKSDIANILKQASVFLDSKYQELLKAVREDMVIYADETGWMVKKQKAWLWIMANEKTTVYFAAESRGKGIADTMYGNSEAFLMTDGLPSYTKTASKDKHLFCWSHMLRFAYEETVNSEQGSKSCFLRDELVRIYKIKKNHPEYLKETLEAVLREEFDKLLCFQSNEEAFIKIQNRIKAQKEGLVLALLVTKDGTNNLAERELRPMVLNRHISYGSDTYTGMETSAKLGSVMQTISKQKDLLNELQLLLQIGVHEKYPQYSHLVYSDT